MPVWLAFLLYLLAALCFGVATVGQKSGARFNLLAAGLLFWVLVPLLSTLLRLARVGD